MNNPFRMLFTSSKYTHRLHRFDGGCIARPAGAAAFRVDAAVVGPDDFLRLAAPDVIRRVEILVSARREPVEHEVLLRTQRSAERRLKWFN